jgi:hypothetical protein
MATLFGRCGSGGYDIDFMEVAAGSWTMLEIRCYNGVLEEWTVTASVTRSV